MRVLSIWASTPFVALLLCIALFPLFAKTWWDKYYPFVATALGVVAALYCLIVLQAPDLLIHAATDYFSFIALVGSLYVIASGIHIRMRGRSTPLGNVLFLAGGTLAANVIGTTGASMILIRPFLRVNKYRSKAFHVVFFIFLVSNIGGALTPVGDPPLFLGYLQGVPFLWPLQNAWHIWLITVVIVLATFYLLDRRAYCRIAKSERSRTEIVGERGELSGLQNLVFLAVVLGAIFIVDPPFLREVLMIGAALASYYTTHPETHEKNEFDFLPIKELAILFAGIFLTMIPALAWLGRNAAGFGIRDAGQFFWATGALSSVLDNAPTYLNFYSVAQGLLSGGPLEAGAHGALLFYSSHPDILRAISVGAVFFGAMTYIGNGPNLMVKSIAEQTGVPCPSFGAYLGKYAFPVLLPTFALIWVCFF